MIIQKFGGTSVGNPERMRALATLIQNFQESKIVVLSAVAGTTNKLVHIASLWQEGNLQLACHQLDLLAKEYHTFTKDLLGQSDQYSLGLEVVGRSVNHIKNVLSLKSYDEGEKSILAQGEILSTELFVLFLMSINIKCTLINALDFMRTDINGEPDIEQTRSLLISTLKSCNKQDVIITQGYICRNIDGQVDNLQRGGSDYTATIVGAALYVDEVQIWTDIDGMHNNDPRVVGNTTPVRSLSYREAAELAYFGAKILHPSCVLPAEAESVPIRLKYTFIPEASGTLISDQSSGKIVTAIAAKDDICAIKIRSGRMINAYGFLRKVFEVFEKYATPIDMITTSEVSVSLTIDNDTYLQEIINEIRPFGEISFEKNQSIICIVGDRLACEVGTKSVILSAFTDIPLRMISYGGSLNNVSILVDSIYKTAALKSLHHTLFVESNVEVI